MKSTMNIKPLVLLHGWGATPAIWQPLIAAIKQRQPERLIITPTLPCYDTQETSFIPKLIADLDLPLDAHWLGWSLGGNLMLEIAHYLQHLPKSATVIKSTTIIKSTATIKSTTQAPSSLTLLASNPSFQQRTDWRYGMPADVLSHFQTAFSQEPEKTLKRFQGLQMQGEPDIRKTRRLLNHLMRNEPSPSGLSTNALALPDVQALANGLTALSTLDQRAYCQLQCPTLWLFAEHDPLVPVDISQHLAAPSEVLSNVGHLPMLSQPKYLADKILQRLCHIENMLTLETSAQDKIKSHIEAKARNKQKVANAFSKAALHYDQQAKAQQRIAQRLLNLCPTSANHILDIGCGTGYWTRRLRDHCHAQSAIGLDLSEGMLAFANQQADNDNIHWLCADAEQLPDTIKDLDLIFSSLAIQWCHNHHALFQSLFNALKAGGKAYIATLLPGTLAELEHSWAQVDDKKHINDFTCQEALLESARQTGFKVEQAEHYCEQMHYPDLRQVIDSIKGVGAHHQEGELGLTGRQSIIHFKKAYESFRSEQGLPVSYQVLILTISKPNNMGLLS